MTYQIIIDFSCQRPESTHIHQVFHVYQLKECKGTTHHSGTIPFGTDEGLLAMNLEKVLEKRLGKQENTAAGYLAQRAKHGVEDTSWKPVFITDWKLIADLFNWSSQIQTD